MISEHQSALGLKAPTDPTFPAMPQAQFDALPRALGIVQCPPGWDYDHIEFGANRCTFRGPCRVGRHYVKPDGRAVHNPVINQE